MEFGRFGFVRSRSWLVFCCVLLCGSQFKGWAQQEGASSPAGTTVPALPVSQAAVGSERPKADSAKAAQSGATAGAVAAADQSSSLLRLGPGDLLEVGVYNVPELATKARIGNSGDIYLPLIDYVHVGDLTVEEAQALIQKRLEDGGFVPMLTLRSSSTNLLPRE
jgi:protein involved in polysaccharide export with SLBB domain